MSVNFKNQSIMAEQTKGNIHNLTNPNIHGILNGTDVVENTPTVPINLTQDNANEEDAMDPVQPS